MRLPFVMSAGLVALGVSLIPRVAPGSTDAGTVDCGDSSTTCADAGAPDGSSPNEGGIDEGGPVTRPADASLRSLDAGAGEASSGEPGGGGSGGGGCSAAGLVRGGFDAELGALLLGAGVLLRRRAKTRGDRAARQRPSASV